MVTKKIKSFAVLAVALLVGMTTSCSNDNEVVNSTSSKKVFLKIEQSKNDNSLSTRSESAPAAEESVKFNSGNLYFVATNNIIIKHYKITPTAEDSENSVGMDELEKGKTFMNLPATVSAVKIIGNTSIDQTTGSLINSETKRIDVEDQRDLEKVNLFGVGKLVPKKVDQETEYTATVLLNPTVSRLEISKIQSKSSTITGFSVEGVFVDNFYEKAYINGVTTSLAPVNGESDVDNFKLNSDNGAYTDRYHGVVFDWYSGGLPAVNLGSPEGGYVAGPKDNNVWGYNVFAEKNNRTASRIIIRLINIEKTEGGKVEVHKGPLFLTVKLKNKNELLKEIEPGKIYSIGGTNGIIFDETNLTPEPNKEHIDVDVTVKIASWERVESDYEL